MEKLTARIAYSNACSPFSKLISFARNVANVVVNSVVVLHHHNTPISNGIYGHIEETTNSFANTPLIAAQAPLDSANVIHCAFRLKSDIAISSSFFSSCLFISVHGGGALSVSRFGDGGNVNSGSGGRFRERRACRGCGVVAVEELVALEEDAEAMGMVVGRDVGEPSGTDVRTVSGLRRWLEALGS